MPTTTANVFVGAAIVKIGNYASAGGASTCTDVGHTKEAITLTPAFEDYGVKSERTFSEIKRIPIGGSFKLKVPMMEVTPTLMLTAFRQPATNSTGSAPNQTVLVGDFKEQYNQVQIVAPGPGTNSSRTITIWRAIVEAVAEVSYGKTKEQMLDVTFACLYDDSVSTADKFFKIVDT